MMMRDWKGYSPYHISCAVCRYNHSFFDLVAKQKWSIADHFVSRLAFNAKAFATENKSFYFIFPERKFLITHASPAI